MTWPRPHSQAGRLGEDEAPRLRVWPSAFPHAAPASLWALELSFLQAPGPSSGKEDPSRIRLIPEEANLFPPWSRAGLRLAPQKGERWMDQPRHEPSGMAENCGLGALCQPSSAVLRTFLLAGTGQDNNFHIRRIRRNYLDFFFF